MNHYLKRRATKARFRIACNLQTVRTHKQTKNKTTQIIAKTELKGFESNWTNAAA